MDKIEIIRHEIETLPTCKLIGKRYTDADRDENHSFAGQWQQWFKDQACTPLRSLRVNPALDDIVGFMRMHEGKFEYWIGHFCRPDAVAPAGYRELLLPEAKVAIVYLRGKQGDPAIFGMHDECVADITRQGLKLATPPFFFERYVCSRFTTPDADGKIILDYGVAIQN